jgi:hypothetical protein
MSSVERLARWAGAKKERKDEEAEHVQPRSRKYIYL